MALLMSSAEIGADKVSIAVWVIASIYLLGLVYAFHQSATNTLLSDKVDWVGMYWR